MDSGVAGSDGRPVVLTSRARRWTVSVVLIAVLGVVWVSTGGPAAAEPSPDCRTAFDPRARKLVYICSKPGSTSPGVPARPAASRKASATCELTAPATYCVGSLACWFSLKGTPFTPPASVPPSPGAQWGVRWCIRPDGSTSGTALWLADSGQPQVPSLQAQAETAIGALKMPSVAAATSPPGFTVVNVQTFFAPATPLPAELRGTSAFGLVAVATPSSWVIDPGDGSAVVRCPATAVLPPPSAETAPDGCQHLYRRPSSGQSTRRDDGRPGYVVRAHSVWSIRYELNGAAVTIAGARTSLDGPFADSVLPVMEVRSVVER